LFNLSVEIALWILLILIVEPTINTNCVRCYYSYRGFYPCFPRRLFLSRACRLPQCPFPFTLPRAPVPTVPVSPRSLLSCDHCPCTPCTFVAAVDRRGVACGIFPSRLCGCFNAIIIVRIQACIGLQQMIKNTYFSCHPFLHSIYKFQFILCNFIPVDFDEEE
jgi:hypothetical protein